MAMGRAYAELTVVDAALAWPVPPSLDLVDAGALPVGLATMHDALVTNGRFSAGDHVAVNAATSGVGVIGVRIALALGAATVIGTSRSASKRGRLVELVADERFVAVAPEDLVTVARQLTDGRGVDVILDNVGGGVLADHVDAAAILGRIVQIGRLGGRQGTLDLDELARKRVSLIGVTFRTRTADERTNVVRLAWDALADDVAAGKVVPAVHARYPLDDVFAALEALRADAHVGKLVITP
jgi:NADPH2:quinone reductase